MEDEERRLPSDLPRSRIPITIVCGAAGSGKSSHVLASAGVDDVVIDLDINMQKLSGQPVHNTGTSWLTPALDMRNRQLRSLASDVRHARAWFVIAAPDASERDYWARMLGGELLVMKTPLVECARRIRSDETRAGNATRMIEASIGWWERNLPLGGYPSIA